MDKRKAWREQEQRLVERWNLAAERYKRVNEEISRLQAVAGGALSEDLMQQAQTARAELQALRRAAARVKVECNSGKRYSPQENPGGGPQGDHDRYVPGGGAARAAPH